MSNTNEVRVGLGKSVLVYDKENAYSPQIVPLEAMYIKTVRDIGLLARSLARRTFDPDIREEDKIPLNSSILLYSKRLRLKGFSLTANKLVAHYQQIRNDLDLVEIMNSLER